MYLICWLVIWLNVLKIMNKINIATVFSGIGSVEHALRRLDIAHDIIFACDIDKYCKQTYFENFNSRHYNYFDFEFK